MIRKQLIFKTEKDISLTYNYQHEVLKNIYRYIEIHDSHKAKFLHKDGYISETGHKYKGFNFTLLFKNADFSNMINCNENTTVKLVISGEKSIINSIIKGLIQDRELFISGETMKFTGVLDDKKVYLKEVVLYSAMSPIITSTKSNDDSVEYLTPYDEDYFRNLANNAKRKYKVIYGKDYLDDIYFDIDDTLNMKEKFIQIKNGGVRGMIYDIWIQADIDMQKIIYYLGLGQNSSIGCGCLNFVKGVRSDE